MGHLLHVWPSCFPSLQVASYLYRINHLSTHSLHCNSLGARFSVQRSRLRRMRRFGQNTLLAEAVASCCLLQSHSYCYHCATVLPDIATLLDSTW